MDDLLQRYMNADDEPTATEAAAALSKALRRKQDLGTLGVLSGGRLAAPGQALLGASAQEGQGLMHAQVARTARLDRKSQQELAAAQHLRELADKQRMQTVDDARADKGLAITERGQALQAENNRIMQGLAVQGSAFRGHEVAAADDQRAKAATDKAEAEVRELAAKVGDSPAMVSEKAARLREALGSARPGELPGFGRFKSVLPDAVISDDGRKVRSDAKELVNTLLFLQSGAGVSNQERENKYNAYGLGTGATEEAFRNGFKVLENDLSKALQAKQAGFTPQAVQTYKERGGVVPADIAGAKAPGAKKKFRLQGGKLVSVGG